MIKKIAIIIKIFFVMHSLIFLIFYYMKNYINQELNFLNKKNLKNNIF